MKIFYKSSPCPYFQFAFDATEMYYRVNDGAFGLLIPKKTEIIIWI